MRTDQGVKNGKERPGADVRAIDGTQNPSLLGLVALLQRVDAVLALDFRAAGPGVVATEEGVDGVSHLLPVLLTEVTAVEADVALAPGLDERPGGFVVPAVLPVGCRRRRCRWAARGLLHSSLGGFLHGAKGQ